MHPTGRDGSWRDEGHQREKTVRARTAASTTSLLPDGHSAPHPSFTPPTMLKQYPPNGGIGMHVQALWSYWPADDVVDELAFPKGAEIRECEDINGDWFWGFYCGWKGFVSGELWESCWWRWWSETRLMMR